MTRGDVVGEMLPLCCLGCVSIAVAQLVECGSLLISQTLLFLERLVIDKTPSVVAVRKRARLAALLPNIFAASCGF